MAKVVEMTSSPYVVLLRRTLHPRALATKTFSSPSIAFADVDRRMVVRLFMRRKKHGLVRTTSSSRFTLHVGGDDLRCLSIRHEQMFAHEHL